MLHAHLLVGKIGEALSHANLDCNTTAQQAHSRCLELFRGTILHDMHYHIELFHAESADSIFDIERAQLRLDEPVERQKDILTRLEERLGEWMPEIVPLLLLRTPPLTDHEFSEADMGKVREIKDLFREYLEILPTMDAAAQEAAERLEYSKAARQWQIYQAYNMFAVLSFMEAHLKINRNESQRVEESIGCLRNVFEDRDPDDILSLLLDCHVQGRHVLDERLPSRPRRPDQERVKEIEEVLAKFLDVQELLLPF
jgi:hypothetical protein